MTSEDKAREQIDEHLTACGWTVQDYQKLDRSAAQGIALREVPVKSGRCDYLLLVDRKPVGVIEAKKEGTPLSAIADQSAYYGKNLPDLFKVAEPLPFYYESTGAKLSFAISATPAHARTGCSRFTDPKPSRNGCKTRERCGIAWPKWPSPIRSSPMACATAR